MQIFSTVRLFCTEFWRHTMPAQDEVARNHAPHLLLPGRKISVSSWPCVGHLPKIHITASHAEIPTMNLGYMYRPDGNYLIRQTCAHCSKPFDTYAMARPVYDGNCCPSCRTRKQWQREQGEDIQAPRKSTRGFQWDA